MLIERWEYIPLPDDIGVTGTLYRLAFSKIGHAKRPVRRPGGSSV